MPDNSLYVTFLNSQAVYAAGSAVEGTVHLVLDEPIKARSLKISLDGRAYTTWDVSRSRSVPNADGTSRTESYTDRYSATTIYVKDEIIAWKCPQGTKEVLPTGSYEYKFAFNLPDHLPPSFEGIHGHIRYMVKVDLDRPWRFDKRDKKIFTVVPTFDLNLLPQCSLPAKVTTVKNLGVILFRHGKVTLECEIPKGGFVAGEMVVVNARVINDSSKDIIKATMKLIEVSDYVAYSVGMKVPPSSFITTELGDNHHTHRRKLAKGERGIKINRKGKGDVQLYLQVPATVPSFNNCPIVRVEYVVEVKFESTGSLNSSIETSLPITIGTIPLKEADGECSTSPKYPFASASEDPPPYPEQANLSPPTYKDSVKDVDGSAVDKADVEPFVPVYPFYPDLASDKKKNADNS